MPFSSGVYTLPANSFAVPVTGTVISSTSAISTFADFTTAFSTCVLKDGTQTITANLPMSSFKLTGLAAGSAAGESVRYEQSPAGILTTTGDVIQTTAANTPARLAASSTVAANATTSNVWNSVETILSGGAVTFTALAAASWVGQVAWVRMNAAHIWTNGATFTVQGGATYTTASGDWVRIRATTVSTFDVTIFPVNGGIVGISGRLTSTLDTPQATTSGTSFTFTAPSGGVKGVTISLAGVSTNGSDALQLQIGPSGGVETSGYLSSVGVSGTFANFTAAFPFTNSGGAASLQHGAMVLKLLDSTNNIWSMTSNIGLSNAGTVYLAAGSKSITGELNKVKLMTNGADSFDAGSANVQWHF